MNLAEGAGVEDLGGPNDVNDRQARIGERYDGKGEPIRIVDQDRRGSSREDAGRCSICLFYLISCAANTDSVGCATEQGRPGLDIFRDISRNVHCNSAIWPPHDHDSLQICR